MNIIRGRLGLKEGKVINGSGEINVMV